MYVRLWDDDTTNSATYHDDMLFDLIIDCPTTVAK
jgi:hypothetical protein